MLPRRRRMCLKGIWWYRKRRYARIRMVLFELWSSLTSGLAASVLVLLRSRALISLDVGTGYIVKSSSLGYLPWTSCLHNVWYSSGKSLLIDVKMSGKINRTINHVERKGFFCSKAPSDQILEPRLRIGCRSNRILLKRFSDLFSQPHIL